LSRERGAFFGTKQKETKKKQMSISAKKIAVIVGAGSKHDKDGTYDELPATERWGLGGALSLVFAREYPVVLMGRRVSILSDVAAEIKKAGGEAHFVQCDVTSDDSVKKAFTEAKAYGTIEVVVFNVAAPFPPGTSFGTFPLPKDVDPSYMQKSFDIGVTGCIRVANNIIGDMIANKHGSFLISGATMSIRGTANFGAIAPVKAALRSYAQSLYNAYAPEGVHVGHIIIDGVIDSPNTKEIPVQHHNPEHLAQAFLALSKQPPTCWTHEIQITPNKESIGMRL